MPLMKFRKFALSEIEFKSILVINLHLQAGLHIIFFELSCKYIANSYIIYIFTPHSPSSS